MALQKFILYMVVGTGSCNHGKVGIQDHEPSSTSSDHLIGSRLLSSFEIEADVPDFDLRSLEIEALEKSIIKERADSQVRANLLMDRISHLKAITHEVAE